MASGVLSCVGESSPALRPERRGTTAARSPRIWCVLLALLAVSLGAVGGARTAAPVQTLAYHHAPGPANHAAPGATHGHGHLEPGPQAPHKVSSPGHRLLLTRRHLSDCLARARRALPALRPRSAVGAASSGARATVRRSLAQLCIYRI